MFYIVAVGTGVAPVAAVAAADATVAAAVVAAVVALELKLLHNTNCFA
mgnify:CR=1 FL=1